MKRHTLEVDSIIKTFGGHQLLTDVYLQCQTNEVVGLLGRNGSGKSSLLKIIFGSLPADNKSIRIDGRVYPKAYIHRNMIAYLPQQNFLPENKQVTDVIRIFLASKKARWNVTEDERIKKYVNRHVSELSSGEKRYLEVFLLLNLPAAFILLDEPFSAVEPLYRQSISELIIQHKATKGFIIADHDYQTIMEISDRTKLIFQGSCRLVESRDELVALNYLPKNYMPSSAFDGEKFLVDALTLKDLALDDPYQENSFFSKFEKPASKGGKSFLEKVIRSPSRNLDALVCRRDAIKFIQECGGAIQVDKKLINFVDYYINFNGSLIQANAVDSLIATARNYYRASNDFYIIRTGIKHVVDFISYITTLIETFNQSDVPVHLSSLFFEAESILLQGNIGRATRDYKQKPLAVNIGRYDTLFRKVLKGDIQNLLSIIYEIEAYEAVAKTATNLNLQYPEYLNSSNPSIEVEGLFHPLLEHPVSNDFIIGTSGNLCFLTGANMSGKSTFLKSFAIAVYLSHLGLPVPAKKMTTTVSNGLFTTINLSDDLNQGYSHFYHEVKRVKEAAYRIKEEGKMIVIFDELFRGTNVKDASESSLSIISALANIPDSLFLISTHIIEIAEKLGDKKSVFFRSFNTKLENDEPVYDYRMIKGVSKESLGALIVRRERIIELLAQKKTNQP